ncbi:MAG: hypothetical protein P9L97_12565 [Candidatus Tenebribacter davisii]|nr:hypothetical protein [Candidatus Tenebribacter davisii]
MKRVQELIKSIKGEIYLNQQFKEDLEWWVLGRFCSSLDNANRNTPVYAIKRKNTNPPDFELFNQNKDGIGLIEVTEVLKPERKRSDEYKNNTNNKKYKADKKNLNSLLLRINDKLLSKFYNTDLLIYLNISIFDISNLGSWHWILYNSIKNWVEENKLDFDICNYNNIFILDSNGSRLFKIYPIYELIYTHDDKERIYRLT